MIDPKLLEILACPKCKGELDCQETRLVCHECGLAYPIRDDLPIMLIDEAEKVERQDG